MAVWPSANGEAQGPWFVCGRGTVPGAQPVTWLLETPSESPSKDARPHIGGGR